jgi:hypothetical protein
MGVGDSSNPTAVDWQAESKKMRDRIKDLD